jgi:alpha-tubulin suppressor-like RCC1 family protein
VQVAAGENHSLALSDSGTIYAWGSNRFGQLGTGNNSSSAAYNNDDAANNTNSTNVNNTNVNTNSNSNSNSNSNNNSNNNNNTIANTANNSIILSPIHISDSSFGSHNGKIIGVAAGDAHSLCFTSSGEVFAWGSNRPGQLGIRNHGGAIGND